MGGALAEGRDQEGRAREVRYREGHVKQHKEEEEEDHLAYSFHITLLFGKMWQAVGWANNRE